MAENHPRSAIPRREALRLFKRAAIRDAARRVFGRDGLEATTMRAIAGEAGYSPGALYSYYPTKDHLLVDLAAQSLGLAAKAVRAGGSDEAAPAARALYAYFATRPHEFDLVLTVFQAARRADGGSPDHERRLTGQLIAALAPIAEGLVAAGEGAVAANRRALAMGAEILGLLMLANSGQLAALGIGPEALLDGATRPRGD
ncbi:MAG TPA: helix-turn-helix domain-containing protein [Alphaproteobacteria bacterium]|jgi:AcrR family transcriptional regulator|nr:helix-turn-helix domain-containing protein [Alphaproteobacteria bacterium]HJM49914.1 helix-turn-helix domain-containing protein [Alphaproteobacteria bacterium]